MVLWHSLHTPSGLQADLLGLTATPRAVVVLVPGLFATSWFFRVETEAGPRSPSHWLQAALRCAVVHYDPRGVGVNRRAGSRQTVDYARRIEDLGEVVAAAAAAMPGTPLVALAHSFGGTVAYGLLATDAAARDRIRAVVAVASPARLQPRPPPWDGLFGDRARRLLDRCSRDGWVDAAGFAWIQQRLASPGLAGALLRPGLVAGGIRLAARWPRFAAFSLRHPLPTFLYRDGDYTPAMFFEVLEKGVLDRESSALLRELIGWGAANGAIRLPDGAALDEAAGRVATPVLTLCSAADALVRPDEAHAWPGTRPRAELPACGHGGYFTRPSSRDAACAEIAAFLAAHG